MNTKHSSLWLGLVALGGVAVAQTTEQAELGLPVALPKVPSEARVGTALSKVDRPERQVPERQTGPGQSASVELDDSIPLPFQPTYVAGEAGDELVLEASGDPFFISFAAGDKHPTEGQLIDPKLVSTFESGFVDGRPNQDSYAFVMFQKRITPERVAAIEALGARVLGFHPHYSLKVAAPLQQLDAISTLPSVRWVGVQDSWQKMHPELSGQIAETAPSEMIDVWINVFESDMNEQSTIDIMGYPTLVSPIGVEPFDPTLGLNGPKRVQSNGWMHTALESNGAMVRNYVDEIQAFRALVPAVLIESLTTLDFVQFIDGYGQPTSTHDESRAMISSDSVGVAYDGSTNEAAVIGLIDTGFDNSHQDLGVWGVGWDCTASGSPWGDSDGHGSHVGSSILGRGNAQADQAGNAAGLASWGGTGRMYQLRFLNGVAPCSWTMDAVYDVMENDYNDGTNTTVRPMAINCSWGTTMGGNPIGTESQARLVDTQVYNFDQCYVFASGNEGSGAGTCRIEPTAKNALTVGNVLDYRNATAGDPGNIWTSSSRGPTGDSRWKPNVSAPGRWIRGVAANSTDGYANFSGTSMAAPHVTGVIGQLSDRWSYLRHRPATVASLLMATAITKNNQTISTQTDAHLDSYGAGRVNSYKAAYDNTEFGVLVNNTMSLTSGSAYQFGNFIVSADVTRIVAVMHYVEPAASAGAGSTLINDWDLWLDQPPIQAGGNTGEWFAQQSSSSNTEIRIIDNPLDGTWQWKAFPDSVTGSVKMSVTIHAIYGDTTPSGSLLQAIDDIYVQPNEDITVTATASSNSYVASGIFLDTSGSTHNLQTSSTTLDDGTVTNLLDNPHGGYDVTLGDVLFGQSRTAEWTTNYSTEGVKAFSIGARSDNWTNLNTNVNVTVDGTAPNLPTSVGSSTHSAGVWSNNPNITYTWNAATDSLSGLAGYGIWLSTSAPGAPSDTQDLGTVTSFATTLITGNGHHFNIKSVDRSGNWPISYAFAGPYMIDLVAPTAPGGLHSTTHALNTPTCNSSITMDWNTSTDTNSGVAGYSYLWSHSTSPAPNSVVNTTNSALSAILPESGSGWYFGVRAIDVAGNSGPISVSGPYFIDLGGASNYCVAVVNSTGSGAPMSHTGSLSIGANNLNLRCTNLPSNQTCIFYYGGNQVQQPFGNGQKCVGGQLFRYSPVSTTTGVANQPIDYTDPPFAPGQITNGSSWNFQCWYRDPLAGGAFFNLSDGLELTFCP
ncbi:MAG: hypothetical protein ACI835_002763 [Planctomycetota bacterium]|jgi:hypothetical protein